ncbi:oxidoreductase family [Fusarium acutatum]|uniref:Oxidoreductase family n=1 Tax=Fusarium acutatum TaxID=78861 RepID=A0A8H4JKH7_9HYPO|nr:oxidoreductase family [Fusarium acutatum]
MAPIRLGIIGLSTNPGSWAAAAHLPYLLSPHGRGHYNIVALCNSAVESAHSAIETFGLPSDTRAYDDPNDLAHDANVDLVVCSTRVDRHYATIKPSISAGKAVFVEWPLASNISQARELASSAMSENIKCVVGLQGPVNAPIIRVRKLLEDGLIGKVLNSDVKSWGGTGKHNAIPESLSYFTQMAVGGNAITIGFGHLWEFLQYALGDAYDIRTRLQLQQPKADLTSTTGGIVGTVESDVPHLVSVTALLRPSQYIEKGATTLVTYQRRPPYPGEPKFTWTITGERGELRLTAEGGTTPRTMASKPVKIELHEFSTEIVRQVPWAWEPWR